MAKGLNTQDIERTTVYTPLLEAFPRPDEDPSSITLTSPHYYILTLVFSIVFVTDLANSVSKAPLIRVFESIICQNHFAIVDPSKINSNGSVEERYCKVGPVQEELALLRGWLDFFDYIPGLFLAIPFGILADRYGRKWLSGLNIASIWLRMGWICFVCTFPHAFPIRLIWLQSALGVLGGGSLVASALFMVIMTDVTPEASRANIFLYAHAALCATEFLGAPLGSVLMDRNPWTALGVSMLLLSLAIPLAVALPETLVKSRTNSTSTSSSSRRGSSIDQPLAATSISKVTSHLPSLGFLLCDHRILFILFVSVSFIFGQACANLVLQYTSRRYGWSLSKAAYLSSVRAAIMILALLGLLPLSSHYLLKQRNYTARNKDALILRLSYIVVTVGLFVEGLAPNAPLFIMGCCIATVGMGASALIRSLLSTLVKQNEVGRLFAVMSLVWTAAMLVASPVVAKLSAVGVSNGGTWNGLPFLFSGVLFAVTTVAIWLASLGGPTMAEHEQRLKEEEELETERDMFFQPVVWTSTTPTERPYSNGSGFATNVPGKSPSDLRIYSGRSPTDGGPLDHWRSNTPLLSPGLQLVGPHERF
jgi:MFS family permease